MRWKFTGCGLPFLFCILQFLYKSIKKKDQSMVFFFFLFTCYVRMVYDDTSKCNNQISKVYIKTLKNKKPETRKITIRNQNRIVNVLTWKRLPGMFLLLLDFPGEILRRIWTTSLMVGRVSGSSSKHSFAKYAITCTSSTV